MEMGSSREPGSADMADDLARANGRALLYQRLREMDEERGHSLAVVQAHGATMQSELAGDPDHASGRSADNRTGWAALIQPKMIATGGLPVVEPFHTIW